MYFGMIRPLDGRYITISFIFLPIRHGDLTVKIQEMPYTSVTYG
tara:strand:+ start:837 stop:968 length:132 start_codon:yes stop_codon:yes gene_type:complete